MSFTYTFSSWKNWTAVNGPQGAPSGAQAPDIDQPYTSGTLDWGGQTAAGIQHCVLRPHVEAIMQAYRERLMPCLGYPFVKFFHSTGLGTPRPSHLDSKKWMGSQDNIFEIGIRRYDVQQHVLGSVYGSEHVWTFYRSIIKYQYGTNHDSFFYYSSGPQWMWYCQPERRWYISQELGVQSGSSSTWRTMGSQGPQSCFRLKSDPNKYVALLDDDEECQTYHEYYASPSGFFWQYLGHEFPWRFTPELGVQGVQGSGAYPWWMFCSSHQPGMPQGTANDYLRQDSVMETHGRGAGNEMDELGYGVSRFVHWMNPYRTAIGSPCDADVDGVVLNRVDEKLYLCENEPNTSFIAKGSGIPFSRLRVLTLPYNYSGPQWPAVIAKDGNWYLWYTGNVYGTQVGYQNPFPAGYQDKLVISRIPGDLQLSGTGNQRWIGNTVNGVQGDFGYQFPWVTTGCYLKEAGDEDFRDKNYQGVGLCLWQEKPNYGAQTGNWVLSRDLGHKVGKYWTNANEYGTFSPHGGAQGSVTVSATLYSPFEDDQKMDTVQLAGLQGLQGADGYQGTDLDGLGRSVGYQYDLLRTREKYGVWMARYEGIPTNTHDYRYWFDRQHRVWYDGTQSLWYLTSDLGRCGGYYWAAGGQGGGLQYLSGIQGYYDPYGDTSQGYQTNGPQVGSQWTRSAGESVYGNNDNAHYYWLQNDGPQAIWYDEHRNERVLSNGVGQYGSVFWTKGGTGTQSAGTYTPRGEARGYASVRAAYEWKKWTAKQVLPTISANYLSPGPLYCSDSGRLDFLRWYSQVLNLMIGHYVNQYQDDYTQWGQSGWSGSGGPDYWDEIDLLYRADCTLRLYGHSGASATAVSSGYQTVPRDWMYDGFQGGYYKFAPKNAGSQGAYWRIWRDPVLSWICGSQFPNPAGLQFSVYPPPPSGKPTPPLFLARLNYWSIYRGAGPTFFWVPDPSFIDYADDGWTTEAEWVRQQKQILDMLVRIKYGYEGSDINGSWRTWRYGAQTGGLDWATVNSDWNSNSWKASYEGPSTGMPAPGARTYANLSPSEGSQSGEKQRNYAKAFPFYHGLQHSSKVYMYAGGPGGSPWRFSKHGDGYVTYDGFQFIESVNNNHDPNFRIGYGGRPNNSSFWGYQGWSAGYITEVIDMQYDFKFRGAQW